MITSFIDGRVRLRTRALRDEKNMALVVKMIRAQDGVTEVTANLKNGSLLVLYDPEKISREKLLEAADALEKQLSPKVSRKAAPKKPVALLPALCDCEKISERLSPLSPLQESALMGGLFLLTAAASFTGKRLHVMLALLFAGVAGVHLYDRRSCLSRNGDPVDGKNAGTSGQP